MKNLKSILFLVIGITIGFSFCYFFSGSGTPSIPSKPVADLSVKELENRVEKKEKLFQQKTDSLNVHEMILSLQLTATKSALEKVKKKNLVLQTQVFTLVDRIETAKADSLYGNTGCDSLQTKVVELIKSDNEKDSLYESTTVNLEEQIKNKDSLIAIHQQQYQSLKSSFDLGILQQKLLADQNSQYRKQVRRQKFKQKLLSFGMIVLSGITTSYLLNH